MIRSLRAAGAGAAVCLLGLVPVAGQGKPADIETSDTVFTNVQLLGGIPVDEFMDTMGMFASSLGFDCVSCHAPEISTNRAAFAESTPLVERARGMIRMVTAINRSYFGGEPRVSCFTCHRGQDRPEVIPSLALQYGELVEDPSAMRIFPDLRLPVDRVFDEYLEALGGRRAVGGLTSFVATGTFEGFNTGQSRFPIEIHASLPGRRTQIVSAPEGDEVKVFDGENGWVAEGWRPLPLMALTGGNLAGARLEAVISFPSTIREAFSRWQASSTIIDGRPVRLLQGSVEGQPPVNFYFDGSGLLVRVVRWNRTAVGTVPTEIDYADYRDVGGVRMPFRTVLTWTGGQNTIQLSEVRANVPIDRARFARPAPFRRR